MLKEFLVAAGALMALAAAPVVMKEVEEEQEREVSLDEVPEAARKVILREAGEHQVLEVDEIVIDGRTYFEAEWIVEDQEIEITVTPEGEIVRTETEESEEQEAEIEAEEED